MVHNYTKATQLVYYCNLFEPDIVIFETADFTVNDGS